MSSAAKAAAKAAAKLAAKAELAATAAPAKAATPTKLSGYIVFSGEQRAAVKAANPNASPTDIMKMLGAKWKGLSEAEKAAANSKAAAMPAVAPKKPAKPAGSLPSFKSATAVENAAGKLAEKVPASFLEGLIKHCAADKNFKKSEMTLAGHKLIVRPTPVDPKKKKPPSYMIEVILDAPKKAPKGK